jgi:hypothetical protein
MAAKNMHFKKRKVKLLTQSNKKIFELRFVLKSDSLILST